MDKGSSNTEPIVILAVVLIIIFLTATQGKPGTTSKPTSTSSTSQYSFLSTNNKTSNSFPSRYIYLSAGNAAYTYQPYEEYVTISNNGRESINITGWQLRNAKNQRAYDIGGSLQYFSQDVATIPQGTAILSPYNYNVLQDIILKPGETAVVTTGQIGVQSPYKIVSFKENMCTGYIESLPEYSFTPQLNYNCPRPADEPGVTGLDAECRQYLERMQYCHTPEFDTRDSEGNICTNCVDGKPLPSSCVTFIKNHFNYAGCVANHAGDKNFSLNTWRVYLGKGWEMWAKKYERIELFDQLGHLIDFKAY